MNTWEETWEAAEDYDTVHIRGEREDRLDMRIGAAPNTMERCQLAAAAPAMARMLIEVETACDDGYDENEVGVLVLKLRPQILELLKKIGC